MKKKQLYPVLAIGAGAAGLAYVFRDKLFPKGAQAAPAASTATPATPATPAGVPAPQAAAQAAQAAAQAASGGTGTPVPLPVPMGTNVPGKAVVTTNDPPPSGDLRIMAAPSHASGVEQVGGAEKSGSVDVITWNAGTSAANNKPAKSGEEGVIWSYVRWPGGPRLPAATGYVPQKYLRLG